MRIIERILGRLLGFHIKLKVMETILKEVSFSNSCMLKKKSHILKTGRLRPMTKEEKEFGNTVGDRNMQRN